MRNAFYVGTSRAKLFLEVFSLSGSDEDLIDFAQSLTGEKPRNRMRAVAAIAGGLKVKIETDPGKAIQA